jgi:hypothetical protein
LRTPIAAPKVTLGGTMSYADAKEIALLRLELRTCWETCDQAGALAALARLSQRVGNDNELAAEVRRWSFKLALA